MDGLTGRSSHTPACDQGPVSSGPADTAGLRAKFAEDRELLFVDSHKAFDSGFRFPVRVVVVPGHGRGNGVLALGGNQEDRTLEASQSPPGSSG